MSETKSLQFETGLVTYRINDTCEVTFNPTDAFFVERLYNHFEALDKKQSEYEKTVQTMADKQKILEFMRERDAEMRAILDDIFGTPMSDATFGRMNVYAMASGLPAWANCLLAVMDECDTAFAREQKATNPRLQKYLAKYQKKR